MVAISRPMDTYHSTFFSFKLKQFHKNIELIMQFPESVTTTIALPKTHSFLCQHAPSVLECQCFNEQHLPFSEEVKHTELAHLFEHILLDQLCQEKAQSDDAEYSGETEWNWRKYPVGSFKVTVSVPESDSKFLANALNRSIRLMEELYADSAPDTIPSKAALN